MAFGLYLHSQGQAPHSEETTEHFRQKLKEQIHRDDVPVLFDDEEDESNLADKGSKMLETFWNAAPRPSRVLGIEQRFSLPVVGADGEELPPLIGSIDAAI